MDKLVIIDDNPNLTDGITRLVNWASYGIEIAGSAANGQEALRLVEQVKPDIVITDISMPLMDGLSFIGQALKRAPRLKMIVLSGFDRFEYAQQAIKLGVIDYLLKPVKIDQIVDAVLRARERLRSERTSQSAARSGLLLEIVGNHELAPAALDRLAEQLALEREGRYTALALSPANLLATAGERLPYAFSEGARGGALICGDEQEALLAARALLAAHQQQGFIGIGRTYQGLEQAARSYQEALATLEEQIFSDAGAPLTYSGLLRERERQQARVHYPAELERELMLSLRSGLEDQSLQLLERFFAGLAPDQSAVRAASLELLAMVSRTLLEAGLIGEEDRAQMARSAGALQSSRTLTELKELLGACVAECAQLVGRQRRDKHRNTVSLAREFIHANLHRDISLDDVAAELHFTSGYLAHLFKKTTGKTVVEYITCLKMERAAELLRDQSVKVSAVALALGYNDRRYFSELFRRHTGCTPSEYREQALGEL